MVYIYSIFVFVSLKGIYTLEIGLFQFVCDEGTPFSFALKPVIVDTLKKWKKNNVSICNFSFMKAYEKANI